MAAFRKTCLAAVFALAGLVAYSACAANYLSYVTGTATRGAFADSGNLNIGREFTVTGSGITVQDLGIWDYQSNGLVGPHSVTLFSLTGTGSGATATPISGGWVVVSAGTAGTLDNGFRFQSLPRPLYLAPGNYAAVAYGMNANDPYGDGGTINSLLPGISHVNYDLFQFTSSGTPVFPTAGNSSNHSSVSFHFTSTDPPPLPPPPPAPLKIMPLGDSITDGAAGGSAIAGYRGPLNTLLNNAGIAHQFVGSTTITPGPLPVDQQHHEGHSGWTITGGGRSGILDNINTWLGANGSDPDIILLMIGTNDVTTYATTLASVPQATANLNTLITRISNKTTGLKPDAHLIIAEITPIVNSSQDAIVRAYNQSIVSLVAQHQALGENVSLVDMHAALTSPADMNDNLHPNASGYNKMAQVWLGGIKAVPEPSSCGLLILAGMTLARMRPRGR